MSKWTYIAILGGVILLVGNMARFTGKGTGVADVAAQALAETSEECTERYAVPAATNMTARAAFTYCGYRLNPSARAVDKALADCMLPKLPQVQSDDGFRVALANCTRATVPAPPEGFVLDSQQG